MADLIQQLADAMVGAQQNGQSRPQQWNQEMLQQYPNILPGHRDMIDQVDPSIFYQMPLDEALQILGGASRQPSPEQRQMFSIQNPEAQDRILNELLAPMSYMGS